MQVVDCHSHFFAYSFFRALAEESPQPGDVHEKLARVSRAKGLDLPDADPLLHWERWRAELDDKGVDHLVTFASLPPEIPEIARVLVAAEGRVSGVAIANPKLPGCAEKVRELLTNQGYSGVLPTIRTGQYAHQTEDRFATLAFQEVSGAFVLDQYHISLSITNKSADTVQTISITMILYDAEGRVTGFRREMLDTNRRMAPGETMALTLKVIPQGANTVAFDAFAEGIVLR